MAEKKLNLGERFVIAELLPKKGNYAMLRILTDLEMKLLPTAKEKEEFNLRLNEDKTMWIWDEPAKEERPLIFEKAEIDIIKDELKKLENSGELDRTRHMSIYNKFVLQNESEKKG